MIECRHTDSLAVPANIAMFQRSIIVTKCMFNRNHMREHLFPGTFAPDRDKELNRRVFLGLGVGVAVKLILGTADMNQSIARKVMGLGRGLHPTTHDDGRISYKPTAETIRRADEMGLYHKAYLGRIAMLLCSGGFQEVASKGKVERPPEGESEAAMQADRLETEWNVPRELLAVEGNSGSTFDNFIKSIEAGYLIPGEFDPDNPLAISASRCHSWRVGPIAQQALDLPPGSLLRLRDGNLENGVVMHTKEHVGYALTRLALAEVDAQPGNLNHTREASGLFTDLAQNGITALGKLACSPRALASLMSVPDVPGAVY